MSTVLVLCNVWARFLYFKSATNYNQIGLSQLMQIYDWLGVIVMYATNVYDNMC